MGRVGSLRLFGVLQWEKWLAGYLIKKLRVGNMAGRVGDKKELAAILQDTKCPLSQGLGSGV